MKLRDLFYNSDFWFSFKETLSILVEGFAILCALATMVAVGLLIFLGIKGIFG